MIFFFLISFDAGEKLLKTFWPVRYLKLLQHLPVGQSDRHAVASRAHIHTDSKL
jgi:hypothetical protein